MLEYHASTTIDAPPEDVWAVLTDTSHIHEWDPYCVRIEGDAALGNQLVAYTTLAPGRAFKVKVSTFDPAKKMVWSSGMPLGLFRGERVFTLKDAGGGRTEFTVGEVFTGPMLFLIKGTIPDMNEPFAKFAAGLKERVEG